MNLTQKYKILFTFTPAFNPEKGGVQRVTYKLGNYFSNLGLEVHYFSLAKEGHVEVEFGQLHHALQQGHSSNIENINTLEKIITAIKPNFVINQMPYEKKLSNRLAELKTKIGFKLIGCLHNSLFSFKNNIQDKISQSLPKALLPLINNPLGIQIIAMRHKFRHAKDLKAILDRHDLFVVLTPSNIEELKYFIGNYKSEKVKVIPNAINDIVKIKYQKEKTILHVGRLNITQKRSDLLLKFWEQLYPMLPDYEFVIVGDGPYKKTLEAEIQKKKIPRISLEGFQQPEPYYQNASFFMMPSAYEGFPMVILEAQSSGCVVLAFSSYAAVSWIVNDNIDAVLCEPFKTDVMAMKALELTKNQEKLNQMHEASCNNASRFTMEKIGAQWMSLFSDFNAFD
ncbi:MAG: glycosyltransferase [Bacteroidetes bacterium]|nr:glycosyltransferase [Bacteroidota bacterium]